HVNGTPPTAIDTLSLHDALPICAGGPHGRRGVANSEGRLPFLGQRGYHGPAGCGWRRHRVRQGDARLDGAQGRGGRAASQRTERSEEHTSELQSLAYLVCRLLLE